MKSLLVVIDLQKSFINENTEMLIPQINELLDKNKFDKVVFTRFINSYDSIWFKKLNYTGCITEESKMLRINDRGNKIIDKKIY